MVLIKSMNYSGEKAKQKADAELQKEIYEKHGVKTDEEQARDESLRSMLKGL